MIETSNELLALQYENTHVYDFMSVYVYINIFTYVGVRGLSVRIPASLGGSTDILRLLRSSPADQK